MPDSIDIQVGGNDFRLLADCGLFWASQSMLFVADTHFGKDASFRRGGIPVPIGSTNASLAKIARMLYQTGASRFCILGDMFHTKSSIANEVRVPLENFFSEFGSVQMSLVRGNHDARIGALPNNWPVEILAPGTLIESVAIGHHPCELPAGATAYLCGHIHPAIRAGSRAEKLGKLPCFWQSRGQLVLPAVGEFTGTHVVQLAADDKAWIVAANQVCCYR